MKKFLTLSIACALTLVASAPVLAAPGDVAGQYYYTDIKTYVYHSPITSYNIGGKTVIDAEILNWHYGFDVYWYEDTRRLEITDKGGEFNSYQAMSGELCSSENGAVGETAGDYYYTDIVTTLNGKEIESYNIGGRTCILAEALSDFGYNVDWNEAERTLTISKPSDFYVMKTDYGDVRSSYVLEEEGKEVSGTNRGIYLTKVTEDGENQEFELKTKSNEVIIEGVGGTTYVRLSDLCEILGAECTMSEYDYSGHTDLVNGISYDTPFHGYKMELNYDASIQPEVTPVSEIKSTYDFIWENQTVGKFSPSLYVNGEESAFYTYWYAHNGETEHEADLYVINGEVYAPAYMAAKLLGYDSAY